MKKILLLLLVLVSSVTFAQNNGITYQAVIYSTTGESVPGIKNSNSPLSNKAICLQFSIVDENTQTEYQEKVTVSTDDFGMVNLVIGNGTQTGGYANSFNAIVWSNPNKYLKVSVDQTGNCSSFELISDQILTYVPYALSANSATSVSGIVGIANGGTNATNVLGAKTNLQLQNVDNTSDLNKPLSTATQTALNTKVDKVAGKDLSTEDFTTAEKTKLASLGGSQDLSLYATNANLALKAPLASPNFTGIMSLNNRAEFGQNIERELPSLKLVGFSKAGTGVNSFWPTQPYAGGGLEIGDGGAVRLVIYRKSSNTFNISTTGSLNEGIGINADSYDPAYTLDINGTLGVRNSITSTGTITAGSVTYPNVDGTSGQVLATNGAGVLAWSSPSGGGSTTVGAISTSSNIKGASITAGELNLAPADVTNGGIVTTGTQTFAGNKGITGNLNVLGKVGLGTSTPDSESSLHISTALPVIFPSMNQTEINAISSPKLGMVQFNTTEKKLQVYSKNTTSITTVFGNATTTSSATCLTSGELWFRPTVSGNITRIELNAFGAGETASLVVKSANSCGTPNNLGTSNSITCIDGWNTWTFATPISVTAGTFYYITSNDANRCLGVRWSLSGDDVTTGNVDNMMGMGCTNNNFDPASRITVVQNVSNSNEWLSLFNTPTASSTLIDVANGGTGSSTKNFVDLSTNQTVAGNKNFIGNIGIGTFSNYASSKLHINGNGLVVWGGTGTLLDASGNRHGYTEDVALTVDGKANNDILRLRNSLTNTLMVVDKDGKMGIGTATPTEKLEVIGNLKTSGSYTGSGFKTPSGTSSQYLMADGSISNSTITNYLPLTGGNITGQLSIGTSSPQSSAVLDVTSTTQGFLPPRMTQSQRNTINTPVAGLVVWCKNCGSNGELQVYNGTTWTNMIGGIASVVPINVGDSYGGGTVIYLFQSGNAGYVAGQFHGIIIANDDAGYSPWGCSGTTTNATGTVVGSATQNTANIIASNCSGTAAQLCVDYRGGGYSDWSMPSIDELNIVFTNRSFLPSSLSQYLYWSSSETSSASAYRKDMRDTGTGSAPSFGKTSNSHVRAVRYF